MTGHAALITGAAGGIGEALCTAFRNKGWVVLATDRGEGNVNLPWPYLNIDLARFCGEEPYREERVGAIRASLVGKALGALVNNAATQVVAPLERLSVAAWRATLDVNVLAPFLLVQALLPELEAARGSVINIASIHARLTKPGFSAYATSKAALVGLTHSLALELGGRVRVNAICPAAIATPMLVAGFAGNEAALDELAAMHPIGEIGRPEDVADMALFLASEQSRFVTGAAFPLDGGIGARLHDPA